MTVGARSDGSKVRLAELLAGLSLATDLGRGRPPEEALRACLVATSLAHRVGVSESEASDVFYTALLRFIGCTADAHELAHSFGGDQVAVHGRGDMMDLARPAEAFGLLLASSRGLSPLRRPVVIAGALIKGRRVSEDAVRADCEVAVRIAQRLGLSETVQRSLYQGFERWDGRGTPRGARAESIALPARIVNVAFTAVMFYSSDGVAGAVNAVSRYSGGKLDPRFCAALLSDPHRFLEPLAEQDNWIRVLETEPGSVRTINGEQLDEVAYAYADFADLKSPYLQGHSRGVARLAEKAASAFGLSAEDTTLVRRSALFHDIGRAGISTTIWEKPGQLTRNEWEEVRQHSYHTQRILARISALAPVEACAPAHHERMDGSGYHRGIPAAMLSRPARLLAAADVYHALGEARPHRAAMVADVAATRMRSMPLDPEAVAVVVAAANEDGTAQRPAWPAGLTTREVEVLRYLARGQALKQIARALSISTSTVHTHEAHIYEKLGISTRAAAALFAMEHGLL